MVKILDRLTVRGWQAEYRFAPPRRWRFDFAHPLKKVAIEVEGGAYIQGRHTRGRGFIADMEKYNTAVAMGWWVLRFTPSQIKTGEYQRFLREMF